MPRLRKSSAMLSAQERWKTTAERKVNFNVMPSHLGAAVVTPIGVMLNKVVGGGGNGVDSTAHSHPAAARNWSKVQERKS